MAAMTASRARWDRPASRCSSGMAIRERIVPLPAAWTRCTARASVTRNRPASAMCRHRPDRRERPRSGEGAGARATRRPRPPRPHRTPPYSSMAGFRSPGSKRGRGSKTVPCALSFAENAAPGKRCQRRRSVRRTGCLDAVNDHDEDLLARNQAASVFGNRLLDALAYSDPRTEPPYVVLRAPSLEAAGGRRYGDLPGQS